MPSHLLHVLMLQIQTSCPSYVSLITYLQSPQRISSPTVSTISWPSGLSLLCRIITSLIFLLLVHSYIITTGEILFVLPCQTCFTCSAAMLFCTINLVWSEYLFRTYRACIALSTNESPAHFRMILVLRIFGRRKTVCK